MHSVWNLKCVELSATEVATLLQVVEVILGIPDIVFMWGSKTKGLFILMIFDIVFKL